MVLLKVFTKRHTVDDDSETNLTEISADLAQMQVTNAGQQVAAHTSCNELSADELEQRLKAAMAAATTQTAKEGLLSLFRSGQVQLLTLFKSGYSLIKCPLIQCRSSWQFPWH